MTTQQQLPLKALEPQVWHWNGHDICYTVAGDGQPMVLIHGFGAAIGHWRKNIPVLAAAGNRVFALDLLGFGASDKPPLAYTLELWESLLKDFWNAHIQEPTVFVGNSIGALLTLMLLANHPETAKAGVLLNAAGGLNHRPEELNLPLRLIMGTFTRVIVSDVFGPFIFDQIRRRPWIRNTLHQVYGDRAAVTDELVDIIHEPSCDPGAQKVFASILTAPPGPHPTELLPKITQPLLVLWGDADPWTPIQGSQIYQDLAAAEPQRVKFMSIAGAGHCPHDERPEVVNQVIQEWLQSLQK